MQRLLSPLGRERTLVLTGPSAVYLISGRPDALEAAAEAWRYRRPAPRTVPVLPDLMRRHYADPAAAEARISDSLMAGLPE